MAINLQNFAETGEVAYIGKHNTNVDALRAFLNALEGTVNTLSSNSANPINAINIGKAAFGPSALALIGPGSFAYSASGSNLTLQPGFLWNGGTAQMFYRASTTVLGFSGRAAATYYISVDSGGVPQISTAPSGAMYSVVWNGSSFGTVTKLATYAPGYQDFLDLLSSAYSGLSYATPDARMEATEKAISAQVTANVASADVTLTDTQAMEAVTILITGAPAAARSVIVPAKAKVYCVRNSTTGGFSTTVNTASGTGVALANGDTALVYCDAANVMLIANQGGGGGSTTFATLTDTPSSYAGQANQLVKVKADETGLEFAGSIAPDVFTGLTDTPTSYAGQANRVVKVKADETGVEFQPDTVSFAGLTDTPTSYAGQAYRVASVKADETGMEFTPGATPSAFIGLVDTPTGYATFESKYVRVKADGTGLEFVDGTSEGVTTFTALTDTPTDYTDSGGFFLKVKADGTGLEFVSVGVGSFVSLSDTPSSLMGGALKVLTVSGDEQTIIFSDNATPSSFAGLTDTPANYSGAALKGVRVNAAGTALEFYDEPVAIGVAWNGKPAAGGVLGLFTAPFAIDFSANLAGSYGIALTAATAQTDIAVDKIAAGTLAVTAVGTVRFAAAGTAPTFIAAAAFDLAAGDALRFKAPATPDATLADFSFSVVGVR